MVQSISQSRARDITQKVGFLLRGRAKYVILLFVVMLIAASAESIGLSLLIPLLVIILDIDSRSEEQNEYLEFVHSILPDQNAMEWVLGIFLLIIIIKSVFLILHKAMSTNLSQKLRAAWTKTLFENFVYGQYEELIREKLGVSITNILAQPKQAAKGITIMLEIARNIVLSLVLIVTLFAVDWRVTMSVVVAGMLVLLVARKSTQGYSEKFGSRRIKTTKSTNSVVSENISAIRQVKIFGIEELVSNLLAKKLAVLVRIETIFAMISSLPAQLLEIFIVLIVATGLIYFDRFASIDIRGLVPLIGFFVVVSNRVFGYCSEIVTQGMRLSASLPSLRAVYDLLNEDVLREQTKGGTTIVPFEHSIEFSNVSFSYKRGSKLFESLCLVFPKGKTVAIVGPSGAGKTTIADLVLRLVLVQSGQITVDGINIQGINLRAWRDKIGYVSQDPYLYNDTVKENIRISKRNASDAEVIEAARMANVHSFIQTLPDRYSTFVGNRGMSLSGGQRQRITIARVLLKDPEILIFDEATSSLDSESEKLIVDSIQKLSESKTILVIAHRVSTLGHADIIYALQTDGTVKEVEYSELLRNRFSPRNIYEAG